MERVKLLLRRKQLHCLWGKTICVWPLTSRVWRQTHGEQITLHVWCDAVCCSPCEENVKREEILTLDISTEVHGSVFYCGQVLCGLYVMHASLLGAISSLAWQPSELVSCSSSPAIREMTRSPVVNKAHGSRGVCRCRWWTVGCSGRAGNNLIRRVSSHMIRYRMHFTLAKYKVKGRIEVSIRKHDQMLRERFSLLVVFYKSALSVTSQYRAPLFTFFSHT